MLPPRSVAFTGIQVEHKGFCICARIRRFLMWSYIFYKGYREAVHTSLSSSGGAGLFKQQSMHITPDV